MDRENERKTKIKQIKNSEWVLLAIQALHKMINECKKAHRNKLVELLLLLLCANEWERVKKAMNMSERDRWVKREELETTEKCHDDEWMLNENECSQESIKWGF